MEFKKKFVEIFYIGILICQPQYNDVITGLMQGGQIGDFLSTGCTPGCPVIKHDPFSPILAQLDFITM